MALKLDIPESLINQTRDMYRDLGKKTFAEMRDAIKKWQEMQPALEQLGLLEEFLPNVPATTTTPNAQPIHAIIKADIEDYSQAKSWLKKAIYVLKKAEQPMTALGIIDYIQAHLEPNLNINLAKNSMPATLSVAAKEGKVLRIKQDGGEYAYTLTENSPQGAA